MKKFQKLLGLSLVLITLIATSCKKNECDVSPVTASFTYEVNWNESGPEVTFTNTSTDAKTYLWNFGDGTTSTTENPVHQYTTSSIEAVTLTSTNGKSSATATTKIDFPS